MTLKYRRNHNTVIFHAFLVGLIVVSPANAMLWFCDIMVSVMGVNFSINCLRI